MDLVARSVMGLDLRIPRDSEALIDEEAFAQDEFIPYWAELWPSATALAEHVQRHRPRGRVLELGCGLGVPALVAARGGADVLAVDWSADAIDLLRDNAARNAIELRARRWDWTADPAALDGPFDLVLGADLVYERRNVAPVLTALDALTDVAWIADPGRPALPEFLAAAWPADRDGTVYTLRRAAATSG